MIGSSKPLASLSSGLLARKGQAKPAMRPQGFVSLTPGAQEDLGWNDMGEDAPARKPVVLRQREALDEKLAPPEPKAVAKPAPAPAAKPEAPVAIAAKSKAAFTLRLDADRHLRLRLASAVTHRSAQQLATEALDRFLDSLTHVDALARQLGTKAEG